ncbi:hypothetical protein RFI_03106 [Reticulomyxa filosa]|uniref:Uncharacterized protein n=1 Tax=Reticulomyxa filosa TaxID=46433 RepID=X6P7F5_RETFI|nr:hypothetical protein RFI_03106 [Reticulomyxa filosa]|eukprot:ETO33989.1 hypothetical protein RFI_03106 [Reticulomyxa filosa]
MLLIIKKTKKPLQEQELSKPSFCSFEHFPLDKHFAIESCGHEKAIFKATGLRNDGRMPESAKESNWEGLLNTIKETFHLATIPSFLLVKKDNIDDHIDNDDDFFDLWNALIKDKKETIIIKK